MNNTPEPVQPKSRLVIGAQVSAALLRGETVTDAMLQADATEPPEPRAPDAGEIPPFFKPGLRPGIRQKLWTRFLVKMYSKKISRTSKVGQYDPDTKKLLHTARVPGRGKAERKIIRSNLTSVPL